MYRQFLSPVSTYLSKYIYLGIRNFKIAEDNLDYTQTVPYSQTNCPNNEIVIMQVKSQKPLQGLEIDEGCKYREIKCAS